MRAGRPSHDAVGGGHRYGSAKASKSTTVEIKVMAETPAHRALRDSSRRERGRDKDKSHREAAGQGLTSSMQRWTPFLHFNVHASLLYSPSLNFSSLHVTSTHLTSRACLPPTSRLCAQLTCTLQPCPAHSTPCRCPEPRLHRAAGREGQQQQAQGCPPHLTPGGAPLACTTLH